MVSVQPEEIFQKMEFPLKHNGCIEVNYHFLKVFPDVISDSEQVQFCNNVF